MNKILATLLIAVALSNTSAFAANGAGLSMETAGNRADFSRIEHNMCVMLDEKIDCAVMPSGSPAGTSAERR